MSRPSSVMPSPSATRAHWNERVSGLGSSLGATPLRGSRGKIRCSHADEFGPPLRIVPRLAIDGKAGLRSGIGRSFLAFTPPAGRHRSRLKPIVRCWVAMLARRWKFRRPGSHSSGTQGRGDDGTLSLRLCRFAGERTRPGGLAPLFAATPVRAILDLVPDTFPLLAPREGATALSADLSRKFSLLAHPLQGSQAMISGVIWSSR